MSPISIGMPLGPAGSTCGYCGPPGERSATDSSFNKAGLIASQLSCGVYQKMIDRGWRRSGTYCYAPDLRRSCCPQYTIKLDALAFRPSRSQRKLINRWNRFVRFGNDKDTAPDRAKRGSTNSHSRFCLVSSIHESEKAFFPETEELQHKFETTLERSSYTDEKYALYLTYQGQIHHDYDNTPMSFKRFLVKTPLIREPIPYSTSPPAHLPIHYGSYHQLYRLDGELIAVGVIDILPGCVSSVYFMYNPKWEKYSLGKISALREVSLAQEIHDTGASSMTALYMGFYIHTCVKMKYKGDYSPSYLADPEEYTWHPLEVCTALLDKYHYATFAHPEHSLKAPAGSKDASPSGENVEELTEGVMAISSIQGNMVTLVPVLTSPYWEDENAREIIISCIRALGNNLAREVILEV
ncbi:arginine-tRNA-protein transferase [Scleroderma yunnanense]